MEYTTLDKISENLDSKRKPITSSDRVEGKIPYYGASGIVDYVKDYIFDESLLLVSEDGANLLARSTPIAFSVTGKTWINNHAHVLRFSNENLQKFVEIYLNSISLESYVTGSAQPKLNQKMLNGIPIPVVDDSQIEIIVNSVENLKSIIELRKQELACLDELIKARFVEMFGDPVTNPKGLPIVALGELSKLITKGASPSWQGFSYTDDSSQTIFVTSENVREGYIDLSSPKYIEDGFNEKQKRSVIHKGDFLINIVGASIGRAAQFNLDCKANMNQAAALVRVNDSRVRDKYLLTYLNSDRAQRMYDSMKSDTGRANLSLQDISDLLILLPNVEQQIEFEMFANQVDKSEFVERFPELSLFFKAYSLLDSEMICIFPYLCPYAESAREIREIFS